MVCDVAKCDPETKEGLKTGKLREYLYTTRVNLHMNLTYKLVTKLKTHSQI
jgi:hypothetical protein